MRRYTRLDLAQSVLFHPTIPWQAIPLTALYVHPFPYTAQHFLRFHLHRTNFVL